MSIGINLALSESPKRTNERINKFRWSQLRKIFHVSPSVSSKAQRSRDQLQKEGRESLYSTERGEREEGERRSVNACVEKKERERKQDA